MALTWKRDKYSGWWAYGERYAYQLRRDDDNTKLWRLHVREVVVTAGVRHTLGQPEIFTFGFQRFDTLAEGKLVVGYFEDGPKDMFMARQQHYREVVEPELRRIREEYDAQLAALRHQV